MPDRDCADNKADQHCGVAVRRITRFGRLRAGLAGCCVAATALALASCAQPGSTQTGTGAGRTRYVVEQKYSDRAWQQGRAARSLVLSTRDPFGACEQRFEGGPSDVRSLAIAGASFTAGVGPDNPALSWADDFARELRWNAVIYGVPGAGYVRTGTDGLGPMAAMLKAERLPRLAPSLVIVQAGHDDGGVPAGVEWRQVALTIDQIRADAPHARIALITVFSPPTGPVSANLRDADRVIVTAARDADPHVIIMDPLTGHWKFQHAEDGLHPTAAGDAWIARKVTSILRANGVTASPPTVTSAVICDYGVRAKAV